MAIPFSQVKGEAIKLKVSPSLNTVLVEGAGIRIDRLSPAKQQVSVDFANLERDDITSPLGLYVGAWDASQDIFKLVKGDALKGDKGDQGAPGPSSVADFQNLAQVSAASIPAPQVYIRTAGYSTVGKGGGLYKYVASEPSHAAKIQSANGRWFELAEDIWTVLHFGAAADGVSDDTVSFQSAASIGRTIVVPKGRYQITVGGIECVDGTHFKGESTSANLIPQSGDSLVIPGSIIQVTSTTTSVFNYYRGNCFEGLSFVYPNQLSSLTTPISYPPTFIRTTSNAGVTSTANVFRNLQFLNSFIWIDAQHSHLEYTFQDLVGCAIYRGILVDGNGGTDNFKQIRISGYYFQYGAPITTWIQANCQGMALGRIDHMLMDDIYMGDLNVGIRFFKGSVNQPWGVYGRMCNVGFETCNYTFYVECTQAQGVLVSNLSICSRIIDIEIPGANSDPVHLILDGAYNWGPRSVFLRSNKPFRLSMDNVTIDDAVDVQLGAGCTGSIVMLSNCTFQSGTFTTASTMHTLRLTGNSFGAAPTLFAPAATAKRYVGNLQLADA